MFPGSPMLWLVGALTLALPATYGVMKVQQLRLWQAAYAQGEAAGKGSASAGAVESAKETATAIREAEEETPLPVDKQAIRALCKQRASCRERGSLK